MDLTLPTLVLLALMAVALPALSRRGGRRYGTLRPIPEATAAYESFRVVPGRQYYTSGPDAWPNALMGIDSPWTLEPGLWKRREMAPAEMKAVVEGMQAEALRQMTPLHGFAILDDRGVRIGDWFSVMGLPITIRVKEGQRLVITTPPLAGDSSA